MGMNRWERQERLNRLSRRRALGLMGQVRAFLRREFPDVGTDWMSREVEFSIGDWNGGNPGRLVLLASRSRREERRRWARKVAALEAVQRLHGGRLDAVKGRRSGYAARRLTIDRRVLKLPRGGGLRPDRRAR